VISPVESLRHAQHTVSRHVPHPVRFAGSVLGRYMRHGCSQFAAAIAFRALFALVPLLTLILAVTDLLLPEATRQKLTTWLHESIQAPPALVQSVGGTLGGQRASALAAVVAAIGLAWTASGLIAAVRTALSVIWDAPGESFAKGKLRDALLVLGSGALALAAFTLSLVAQVISTLGADLRHALGLSSGGTLLADTANLGAAVAATLLGFLVLYRVCTTRQPRIAALWRGALVGAVCYQLATRAYSLYLSRFGDLSLVYGSAGAVLGFLLVLWSGAASFLIGAEVAGVWAAQHQPAHDPRREASAAS
jgi:membrane protein